MRRARRARLAVALLAPLAGGCGGSGTLSAGDYQQRMNAILVRAQSRVALDPGAARPALAAALDRGATVYGDAAHDAGKLRPPSELSAEQRQLVAALSAMQAALRRGAGDARSGSHAALTADLVRIANAEQRLTRTAQRVNRLVA